MIFQILEKLDRIERTISSDHQERWINIKGVSTYSSLSIPKIRRAVAKGELKVSRSAEKLLIKKAWVDKWLNS